MKTEKKAVLQMIQPDEIMLMDQSQRDSSLIKKVQPSEAKMGEGLISSNNTGSVN